MESAHRRRVRFSAPSTRTGCASNTRTTTVRSPTSPPTWASRHPTWPATPASSDSRSATASPPTKHILADHGGPNAFSTPIWTVFAARGAEQRLNRLLAIPGHPDLDHAAKHLGARKAVLVHQVRQVEHAVGTTLLEIGQSGRGITLTPAGEKFAQEVRPILAMLHPTA